MKKRFSIKHISSVIKILLHYFFLRIKLQLRPNKTQNKKIVFFDLTNIRASIGTYYYSLIYFFHEAGYTIEMANNPRFLGQIKKPLNNIFKCHNLFIKKTPSHALQSILICDDTNSVFLKQYIYKKVIIDFNYFSKKDSPDAFLWPFTMHPEIYHLNYHFDIYKLRKRDERIKILFAGNAVESAYSDKRITDYFGCMTRFSIIDIVRRYFTPEKCIILKNYNDIESFPDKNVIVLNLFEWTFDGVRKNMESKISREQWLPFLSKADFWLACPGVVMPHCHNIIEAMSVGTIPIIEYEKMFAPPLVHMENCIYFKGEKDLVSKIEYVLGLPKDIVRKMRSNVINYYDENLAAKAVIDKLEKDPKTEFSLKLNGGFQSVELINKD